MRVFVLVLLLAGAVLAPVPVHAKEHHDWYQKWENRRTHAERQEQRAADQADQCDERDEKEQRNMEKALRQDDEGDSQSEAAIGTRHAFVRDVTTDNETDADAGGRDDDAHDGD